MYTAFSALFRGINGLPHYFGFKKLNIHRDVCNSIPFVHTQSYAFLGTVEKDKKVHSSL